MSKKTDLLKKEIEPGEYDLTNEEILELASLTALIEQAEAARNYMNRQIAERVATRLGIIDQDISFNWDEIMTQGAKSAKLIVK